MSLLDQMLHIKLTPPNRMILTVKFPDDHLPLPGAQRGRIPEMFHGTPLKFYSRPFGDIR